MNIQENHPVILFAGEICPLEKAFVLARPNIDAVIQILDVQNFSL